MTARRLSATIVAIGGVLLSAACGGSDHGSVAPGGAGPVARVIVVPAAETLSVGQTAQLAASTFDEQASPLSNRVVTWATASPSIATVTSTGQVTGVGPGQAIISATSEGKVGTAVITVGAASVSGHDLAIVGALFTQGVQDAQGSVPMVLGGSPAVVNVFLTAVPATATPTRVVLRLFDAGGTFVYSDTATTSGTLVATVNASTPAAQFLVPAARLAPGVHWQLVRDPLGALPDDSAADDVYPRSGTQLLSTATVPALTIRFVPIALGANGGTVPFVDPAGFPDYLRTLKSIHPLGIVSAHVGATFTTSASFGAPPSGGDQTFWTTMIAQLDLARIADPVEPDAHWFGVVLPPPGFNFTAFGGFSYIPSSGTAAGPNTRTGGGVGPGWFARPTQSRDLLAHELGHSFGRLHAPCGGAGAPLDPAYPIPSGTLDVVGFDVYSWANGLTSSAPSVALTTGDVMGYCFPVWASVYTYTGVLAFRQPTVLANRIPNAPLARQRVVVIRGSIAGNGAITLEPAFTLDARPTVSNPSSAYRVTGVGADGRTLFSAGFDPAIVDHAPDVRHFTVAVPATGDIESLLDTISVSTPAGQVRLTRAAAAPSAAPLAPGAPPMLARAVSQQGGSGPSVSCAGGATRGIVVLDATGAVAGVASAASASLATTPNGPMTVLCSDGLRTTRITGVRPVAP